MFRCEKCAFNLEKSQTKLQAYDTSKKSKIKLMKYAITKYNRKGTYTLEHALMS
jgi:uncharacterized phage-like protein YoqJ